LSPEEQKIIEQAIADWSNSREFIYWSQMGTNESEADWT
jgi:hypothetical protein